MKKGQLHPGKDEARSERGRWLQSSMMVLAVAVGSAGFVARGPAQGADDVSQPITRVVENVTDADVVDSDHMACTGLSEPPNFAYYSLGAEFAGKDAIHIERRCGDPLPGEAIRANFVSFIYAGCGKVTDLTTECGSEVEVQTWPSCERSLADYEIEPGVPYPATPLGKALGVPAYSFDGGTRIELYTGESTVVIFSSTPEYAAAALTALHSEVGEAPSEALHEDGAPVSGSIAPPAAGSIDGQLECGA